ncbi:MAG TPA: hypothetical protein VFH04_02670, partial [Nitrososphaeraceae archaeon]|nr:hypothetical protein [Nitrososphaeraceae archaeon]
YSCGEGIDSPVWAQTIVSSEEQLSLAKTIRFACVITSQVMANVNMIIAIKYFRNTLPIL